jgi:hypothetical protein
MPIYTSGGTIRIDGAYNDVGRDMYTYSGDTHRHVNSHNVEKTTTAGSYNDSSMNKGKSCVASFFSFSHPAESCIFRERQDGVVRSAAVSSLKAAICLKLTL